jgi:hypothetical protein
MYARLMENKSKRVAACHQTFKKKLFELDLRHTGRLRKGDMLLKGGGGEWGG